MSMPQQELKRLIVKYFGQYTIRSCTRVATLTSTKEVLSCVQQYIVEINKNENNKTIQHIANNSNSNV